MKVKEKTEMKEQVAKGQGKIKWLFLSYRR